MGRRTTESGALSVARIMSPSYQLAQPVGTHTNGASVFSHKRLVQIHTLILIGERLTGQSPGPLCMVAQLGLVVGTCFSKFQSRK